MNPLYRKLRADLWQMRGQILAVILVIAAGVATFVMARCTLESLQQTQARYYRESGFADVFVHLRRAPRSMRARLAEIPGIADLETRLVEQVRVDLPNVSEPASARLISISGEAPARLNRLHLRSGRWLNSDRPGEILVSEGFALKNGIRPGDSVRAILHGRLRLLHVAGIAMSPEFIFLIREGELLPSDQLYGVFWMQESEMAAAFDLDGAFNDVICTLHPTAVAEDVLRQLDTLTASLGGPGAILRADQSSHRFVTNELQELRGMAVVIPAIFLGISAFLLNMVISRLILMQREQIAALRAFGYRRFEIGWHYTQLVLLIVVLGVLIGTVAGFRLGQGIMSVYADFFHFPVFEFHGDTSVVLTALGATAAAAFVGTVSALARAVSLPPAEAMRPEPPARFGASLAERLGFSSLLSEPVRLMLRQLERSPGKSLLSMLGIALSVAVLILGSFALDAVEYVIDAQYRSVTREDLTVILSESSAYSAVYALERLPGVRMCEPFRMISAELVNGVRSRQVAVTGLESETELHRLVDIHGQRHPLPEEGVVLSRKLAEILGTRPGDELQVEFRDGRKTKAKIIVTRLITDFSGLSAHVSRRFLNRLLGDGDLISGAFLAADAARTDLLFQKLRQVPLVASVNTKHAVLKSFRETIARNVLRMRTYVVMFAGIITFGVVFNSARIALAERSRELATLRVIGFTRREVAALLLGELALLTVMAIPLGLFLGYALAAFVIHTSYDTELFRMPLIIDRSTYGFAAVCTCTAALLSAMFVRRMINRLDLVAVLKTRE